MQAPAAQAATLVHLLAWALGLCVLLLVGVSALALRQHVRRKALCRRLEAARAQLDSLRGRDALTGLMARADFEAALDTAVADSDRSAVPLAVLCIGLDNFRPLNDGYGHRVGDAVLAQTAARLQAAVAAPLALARLAGDEFALLLGGPATAARAAAEQVLRELQRPFAIDTLALHLSASVGIAVYPDHGARPRLLGNAALAMRSVKQMGGGGHAVYNPALAVDSRDQAELLQDLGHALKRGELQLVYQPKVDAKTLQITAAEALLRWQHPQRGTIAPALFVPLAERHGLIGAIGRWVIEQACRQAAQWRGRGLRMRVAVNISGHQLRQDDFVEHIETTLRYHGIPAGRLTCEITESVAVEDTAHTRAAFARMCQAGLHVSIDDFGTGQSSLAALRNLPAAELKIDRAFVVDLESSASARQVVQAIVQMARTLGLRVVAEGVETDAQRDALVALGCDELQGYLFARPMSATALALWAETDDSHCGADAAFRPSLFLPTAPAGLD